MTPANDTWLSVFGMPHKTIISFDESSWLPAMYSPLTFYTFRMHCALRCYSMVGPCRVCCCLLLASVVVLLFANAFFSSSIHYSHMQRNDMFHQPSVWRYLTITIESIRLWPFYAPANSTKPLWAVYIYMGCCCAHKSPQPGHYGKINNHKMRMWRVSFQAMLHNEPRNESSFFLLSFCFFFLLSFSSNIRLHTRIMDASYRFKYMSLLFYNVYALHDDDHSR